MKIRRLTPTAVAFNGPRSENDQFHHLKQLVDGVPRFTYAPVREVYPDLFDVAPSLFPSGRPTSWKIIDNRLRKRWTREGTGLEANLIVARTLYDFSTRSQLTGRQVPLLGIHFGQQAGRIAFWSEMALDFPEGPTVVFIDPRRSTYRLDGDGRHFIFSAMHEGIRRLNPDFMGLRLAIIQLRYRSKTQADVELHLPEMERPFYTMVEMQDMVDKTHQIWAQLHSQPTAARQKRANKKVGPLINRKRVP